MIKINRIEIKGYRGITRACSLNLDSKSLLLFGENGTGKSSFLDAIEKLFTGKVSTLEGRMGISTERHGPNIRVSIRPKISVLFSEGTEFSLESKTALMPSNVKEYLTAAQESIYILRRRQILDFIESKPHERYEMLRPFLPLTEAEEIETALREAFNKVNKDKIDAERNFNSASMEIAQAVDIYKYKVPVDENQICAALSVRLKAIGIKLQSISDLNGTILTIDERLKDFGDTEKLITIQSSLSILEELKKSLSLLDFEPFRNKLHGLRAKESTLGKTFFEDVLNRGLEWIRTDWQGLCPLCETPWDKKPRDRNALVARIQTRLNEMKEVVKFRREADQARRELIEKIRKVQDLCLTLKPKFETLKEEKGLKLLEEVDNFFQNLRTTHEQRLDQISVNTLDAAIKSWNSSSYATMFQNLITSVKNTAEGLPSPEKIKPLVDLRSLLSRINALWQRQNVAQFQYNLANLRAQLASTMLRLAEEARREEVQELFDHLSEDINTLYLQLNPDEDHGDIQLEVRQEVRGSASIRGKFFDRTKEDPRAYYSDAHLDTLGLCTFLALRRWYRDQHPNFNLLILDDVLTSVDAQHAVRTAELILKKFGDYQILLTTHDRIWYEYLRDIQARCRVKGEFLNKVIHKWTIEEGPDIREPEEERKRLDQLLSSKRASQIAVEAGRLLEHVLQEMRYSIRLSVQAKRGELYEIGEIWPAFYSMLRKSYPGFYEKCGGILDSLDIRWPIRNWIGAHFNQWASRISRKEVVEFGHKVGKLFDCVFCNDCRRFIEPSMTPAGQLSCRCGDLIYPVPGKKPLKPLRREELVELTKGAFRNARLSTKLYFKWERAEKERENN